MAKATDELVAQVTNTKTKKKGDNKVKQTNIETVKTVIIAVLITAIIAFIAGIKYQANYSNSVKAEAKELSAIAPVEASKQ